MIRARGAGAVKLAVTIATFVAVCACAVAAQKQPPAHPLDLNVANVKELEQVSGIGPNTAQAMVDVRHNSGRFQRVEDLLASKGISRRKLDKICPYLKITAPPPAHKSPQP